MLTEKANHNMIILFQYSKMHMENVKKKHTNTRVVTGW